MSVTDECFWERVAIAQVDGQLPESEAINVAVNKYGILGRQQLPDTWARLNRRWRAVVADTYSQAEMPKVHEALKKKHGVESFKQLTVGQIWRSIQRISDVE